MTTVLNGSSEELWTDTDDESFVRATQCLMDGIADDFTSPAPVTRSVAAVTSTPNIKLSRCRRTFSYEPPPAVPCGANTRHAAVAPVDVSSPLRDASFGEELLATLAEPDDVLDSQLRPVDGPPAVEMNGSVEKHDIHAGCTNTGHCHLIYHITSYRTLVVRLLQIEHRCIPIVT